MSAQKLPHDQALPNLAVAFDCERMTAVLQRVIDSNGVTGARIVDCSIARSKYRLGRNCMMLYRTAVVDRDGRSQYEQLYSCGIYTSDESKARYRKALDATLVAPRRGPPLALVAEHNMVVWAYPNERKLGALALLADEARLRADVLPEVVEARWGVRRPIRSITTRIAGYFPEHACCIRVGIRFSDRHEPGEWVVFGKTSFDDRGADTLAAMQWLWQSPAQGGGRLGLARPLCYQAAHRLVWQESVPGETVESLLLAGAPARPLFSRIGLAVAELHRQALPGLRVVHASDALATLCESSRLLGLAEPSMARRIEALARTLAAHDVAGDVSWRTTLHGDLHLNNMLADSGNLYLVDFDSLRSGNPAIELGSFVAALHYRGLLHRTSEQDSRDSAGAFLSAYESVSGTPVSRREIAWHAAAALIHERMSRCLTSLKPGRFELMDALLRRAEVLCADAFDHSRLGAAFRAEGALS